MVSWMAQGQESNVMDGRGQQRQRICTTGRSGQQFWVKGGTRFPQEDPGFPPWV